MMRESNEQLPLHRNPLLRLLLRCPQGFCRKFSEWTSRTQDFDLDYPANE